MTTDIKIELFLMLVVGSAIAVAITFLVLKKMGRINPAAGQAMDVNLAAQLSRKHPNFARLDPAQQRMLARKVRVHPGIWFFALSMLAGFIWAALSVPALRDWIDHGGRAAALIAIPLFAIIFGGIALIRRMLIVRMLAKLPSTGD